MYQPTQAEINLFIDMIRTSIQTKKKKNTTRNPDDPILSIIKNRYQKRKLSQSIDRQLIKLPPKPQPHLHNTQKRTFYQLYQEQMVRKYESRKDKHNESSVSKTQMLSSRNINTIDINIDKSKKQLPRPVRKYFRSEQVTPNKQIETKKKYFIGKQQSKTESEYLLGIRKQINLRKQEQSRFRIKDVSSDGLLKRGPRLNKVGKFKIKYSKGRDDSFDSEDKFKNVSVYHEYKKRDLRIDPWVTIDQCEDL